jgi:hypothetical protein
MYDTVQPVSSHLSRDMPCASCGHAMHTFLACSDICDCAPARPPAAQRGFLVAYA